MAPAMVSPVTATPPNARRRSTITVREKKPMAKTADITASHWLSTTYMSHRPTKVGVRRTSAAKNRCGFWLTTHTAARSTTDTTASKITCPNRNGSTPKRSRIATRARRCSSEKSSSPPLAVERIAVERDVDETKVPWCGGVAGR